MSAPTINVPGVGSTAASTTSLIVVCATASASSAPRRSSWRDPQSGGAHDQAADRYLVTESLAVGAPVFQWPAVPALFVLPPDAPSDSAPATLFAPVRSARIIVVCRDTRDPERPTSTIEATRQPSVSLDTILGAL